MQKRNKLMLLTLFIVCATFFSGCSVLSRELTFPPDDLDESNLVRNGDFKELTAPNRPAEWSVTPTGDYLAFVDSEQLDGQPALRLVGGPDEGRLIVVQREIEVADYQNKTLKLSAWYKGNHVAERSGAENFVRAEFYKMVDDKLTSAGGSKSIRGSDGSEEWSLLDTEFEVYPDTEIMWISISLRNSSGEASWAGIDLREVEH